SLEHSSGRIDSGRDAIVGGPHDETPVLHRPHANQAQMLLTRGAVPKVSVVGEVQQYIRAMQWKLSHQVRKRRLIADEDAQVIRPGNQNVGIVTRYEVA